MFSNKDKYSRMNTSVPENLVCSGITLFVPEVLYLSSHNRLIRRQYRLFANSSSVHKTFIEKKSVLDKAHELHEKKTSLDRTYNPFLPAQHVHFLAKAQVQGAKKENETEKEWTDRQRLEERKKADNAALELISIFKE
jgi:shikimate 5-dehydrogenase